MLRDLSVPDGAVVGLQGGFVGVELIRPLQQLAGILAVLRDDELILAVVQESGIGFHIAAAVGTRDRFHNGVVLGVAQQLGVRRPGEDDARAGAGFGILHLGADHVGSLGEILGIQRAALKQVAGPCHGGLVVFGHGNEDGLAFRVHAHHVAGAADLDAEGQEQVVEVKLQGGRGDVAVAAFAGLGERHQGVRQLRIGGRHGQVQFLQPDLVDVHFIGGNRPHGQLLGQAPDLALGVGAQGFQVRILFEDRGQVGHMLRDQVRQFHKEIRVGDDVGIRQGDGTEERVRHGAQAGGQHQRLLIAPVAVPVGLPFNGHAGLLADFLQQGGLGKVGAPHFRPADAGDREGRVFLSKGSCHGEQQAEDEQQGKQFLHVGFPPYYWCILRPSALSPGGYIRVIP